MPSFILSSARLKPRKVGIGGLIACALALPVTAMADIDWSSADWGGYSVDSLSYWSYSDMSRRSMEQAQTATARRGRASAEEAPQSPPSQLSTASNVSVSGGFVNERGLEGLARMYPRDQFYDRKKQYRQIVEGFNQSVQKLYGVPPNNLATGMTVVLAGAYSAYNNQRFPDAWVKPLYQQMEAMLLRDPRLPQRSAADKASDYQVMVGAGMAMMLTQAELEKAPSPAALKQLRDTGADALRTLFKAEPDAVAFSRSGLQVR